MLKKRKKIPKYQCLVQRTYKITNNEEVSGLLFM